MSRQRTANQIWAHGQILQKVENGSKLFDELIKIHDKAKIDMDSLSIDEKKRYNEICDIFVAHGIAETTIESALG